MAKPHPVNAYYDALGCFIHHFAQTESLLLAGLRQQAGVDEDTARAIFSGTRVDNAKSFINRLREIRKLPDSPTLKRAFAQLTIITTMRNDIVHYGAEFKAGFEPRVSTRAVAMPGNEREHIVTPDTLDQMTADLGIINNALSAVLFDAPSEEVRLAWEQAARQPWHYRPS